MKKTFIVIPALLVLFLLFSCDNNKTTGSKYTLPDQVQNIVTDSQLDQLKQDGLPINEGVAPPNVEGVYLADRQYCVYSTDGYTDRYTFDYYYQFYNQTAQNTVKLSYTGGYSYPYNDDVASGEGAFISGSGSDFSVFVEAQGTYSGITYTQVTIYSGTLTGSGISDFQFGFILTEKSDDPSNYMMDVNGHRIFTEDDGIASTASWPQ